MLTLTPSPLAERASTLELAVGVIGVAGPLDTEGFLTK